MLLPVKWFRKSHQNEPNYVCSGPNNIEIPSDEDLFVCFEFCSKSYLGTHTIEQRRDYTQQIFDFYNKNFPGISIYKDQNFKLPPLKFRVLLLWHLTPQGESSERHLPGTIVPKRKIFEILKNCILHSRLSLIGLSSKYFNVCSNTHCPRGVKRLKRHQSCRVRFKIREKATQVKSNLMNCLRHFWKENSTKWIFQTWIVTLMSLQKQHAKHFNHCSSSMLFHPILNIQIIMAQWISSTICLTSSGPQGLLIQSNYIFNWQF